MILNPPPPSVDALLSGLEEGKDGKGKGKSGGKDTKGGKGKKGEEAEEKVGSGVPLVGFGCCGTVGFWGL